MASFVPVSQVLPSSQSPTPLRILLDDGTTPGPTTPVGKSRLSVVSRVD